MPIAKVNEAVFQRVKENKARIVLVT